jgi:hypothetical protein
MKATARRQKRCGEKYGNDRIATALLQHRGGCWIMQTMKMLIRGIICATLIASLSFALLPVQANLAPPKKNDCCAKMRMSEQHKDCAKHGSESPRDQQCCATCFACVAIAPAATAIPKRSEREQSYFKFVEAAKSRALRPPVPPPRDALS